MWIYSFYSILLLIVCRAHYTVDVILGFWMSFFVVEYYHARAYDLYRGDHFMGKLIRKLETWGPEWENVLEPTKKAGALPQSMDLVKREEDVRVGL